MPISRQFYPGSAKNSFKSAPHRDYTPLIHKDTDTSPTSDEWNGFIKTAVESGMFKGGSAISARQKLGRKDVVDTTETIGGFMRFDAEDFDDLMALLNDHPVVKHGGTVELCEMPKT